MRFHTPGVQHLLVASLLSAAGAGPLVAQTVTRDATTGDYRVSYVGTDGEQYSVVVLAANKVDPSLSVTLSTAGDATRYAYAVSQQATARAQQPIYAMHVPCSSEGGRPNMMRPEGWRSFPATLFAAYCSVSGGSLGPGESVSFSITSRALPAIRAVLVEGLAPPPAFASGEATPAVVSRLVDSLTTPAAGGMLSLLTVVPARPRAAVTSVTAGLDSVRADLRQTCALDWISNAGLCHRLQEKLDHAAQSLERRNGSEEARRQLAEFLEELEDQHGPEPGRHASESREPEARHGPEPGKPVNAGAYWLLKVNVEYLRGLIPGREARER